ncbi:phosphopantetheine-binding protein [Methylotenera versatilis]|uniref:Phosphopantetheine-binding protein n=1 Tax=Methylotenera versatilis (strain 301) TaxID=666681 RepID=D7DJC5_METV0|nr:phosphopantetheine-binding protein [Methylotenera versatilis]ADI30160.1 phosphopantetheine-binding protein [Methylotenera versatilis 301]
MTINEKKIPSVEEVSNALAKMIADKMEIDITTVLPESNLQELGLDSLDTFDIIFSAEDYFKIKVPNDQVKITTLQDVAVLVHQLILSQKS